MISICIPTYERTDLLFESFAQVIDDERVSEIVIVDDCSSHEVFWRVQAYCAGKPKIRLYSNDKNLDCYRNKREAIGKASNDWCILLDSDNVIGSDYLDVIESTIWKYRYGTSVATHCLLTPDFAKPHFDFRKYSGKQVFNDNVHTYMNDVTFQTMLNAANYVVHRDEYLRVWDGSVDPVTSDSIFQVYNWLKAGNSIYVVPGLEYFHRVHNGSHYQTHITRTPKGFHEGIVNKLKQMR